MAKPTIKILSSDSEVVANLGSLLQEKANETLARGELFKVGLSGGSLVKFLCCALPALKTDWSKWVFFFCDERVVPFNDLESTFGLYHKALIGPVPITEEQFVRINPALPLQGVADDYIKKLQKYFTGDGLPRFDVLLLGMGPDGHTCSLFPGHKALQEKSVWVTTVGDSPKPPPCRITLTLSVVNNAHNCIFVSTGASKADMIKRVLQTKDPDPVPSALVRPHSGQLYWILDEGAASLLNKADV